MKKMVNFICWMGFIINTLDRIIRDFFITYPNWKVRDLSKYTQLNMIDIIALKQSKFYAVSAADKARFIEELSSHNFI